MGAHQDLVVYRSVRRCTAARCSVPHCPAPSCTAQGPVVHPSFQVSRGVVLAAGPTRIPSPHPLPSRIGMGTAGSLLATSWQKDVPQRKASHLRKPTLLNPPSQALPSKPSLYIPCPLPGSLMPAPAVCRWRGDLNLLGEGVPPELHPCRQSSQEGGGHRAHRPRGGGGSTGSAVS